jgi:hypothetical protein
MGDDGCSALFEARERLEFFNVVSLPVPGTLFILCADVDGRFYASGF